MCSELFLFHFQPTSYSAQTDQPPSPDPSAQYLFLFILSISYHLNAGGFSRNDVTPVPVFFTIFIDSTSSTLGKIFFDFSYEFFGDTLFFINFYDEVFFGRLPESVDPKEVLVTKVGRFALKGLCVGDIFLDSFLGEGLLGCSVSPLFRLALLLVGRAVMTGDLLLTLGQTDFLTAFLFNSSTFFLCSIAMVLMSCISVSSFLNSTSFSLICEQSAFILSEQCFYMAMQFFYIWHIFWHSCVIYSFSSTCLVSILELSSSYQVLAQELSSRKYRVILWRIAANIIIISQIMGRAFGEKVTEILPFFYLTDDSGIYPIVGNLNNSNIGQ